jgi:putative hemolysin
MADPVVIIVVTVLILVNALYVAAEFGAVSARRSRIQELANQGNWLARQFLPVARSASELDRYVATCQIGITLSSLVLGAYGQATLAVNLAPRLEAWGALQPALAESTAAAIVLTVLTALQVVVGELIPKSLALQKSTAVALYTLVPMKWSIWVFRWFIAILNGSGKLLLNRLGMPAKGHRHIHSPEELELLITESRDGGLLEPEEQRRLHQALRLGLRSARQVMVPRDSVVGIDAQWTGDRLLEAVLSTPFSRLPVYEGSVDRVIGVLNTKALILAYLHRRETGPVRDLMMPVTVVPETMPADQLLRFLRERRTTLALVIDEFGDIAGLVTLADVVAELLGDVGDELKGGPREPARLPDGRYRVSAQMPLQDAERWLGTTWESHADTLGGHVMQVLGRMPTVGDQVVISGIRIAVERLRGRVPGTLLVTPRAAARGAVDG